MSTPTGSTQRAGLLGWVLIAITAIVLIVTILLTLNMLSRDTLDPLPSNSVSAL